jgi:hypothetical protein
MVHKPRVEKHNAPVVVRGRGDLDDVKSDGIRQSGAMLQVGNRSACDNTHQCSARYAYVYDLPPPGCAVSAYS